MDTEKELIAELTNTYEFGWNITRATLVGKQTYNNKGWLSLDSGLMKDLEAERLWHKYSRMLLKEERRPYCEGALDLIREWDRIGKAPKPLESFYEESDEEDED